MIQQSMIISLLILQISIGAITAKLETKLLHVLFRHGDKVPHKEYQNYPNDPLGNHSYFPIGNGGLTNEGKLREYKIGQVLREQYDEFLGGYYLPGLVYGRSTDIPRAQMSLQLVLAGLFPPTQEQMWNPRLPWIPVSTVSVPNERDGLLFPHHCPQYIKEYRKLLEDDDIQKKIHRYKGVMDYLSEHTGKRVDKTSAVYYLYNLFKEQAAQNLTLPSWTQRVYPNPMREITALDFHLRSYTQQLRRLNGGILLREMAENMKALRAGVLVPCERKAFLYSAHEVNVVALARTLGITEPRIPLYGSTIILETLQDEYEHYYVQIFLWTGVTETLVKQTIPGCLEVCPLEDFLEILRDVIPNEKEANCWSSEDNEHRRHHRLSANSSTHRIFSGHITPFLVLISFYLSHI